MTEDELTDRWAPWSVVQRVGGGAITVPVVTGFLALGAGVLIVRSLRDVVSHLWGPAAAADERVPRPPKPRTRRRKQAGGGHGGEWESCPAAARGLAAQAASARSNGAASEEGWE